MAAVFELNILCLELIDIKVLIDSMENCNIYINTIKSIDNWAWENEKDIKEINSITALLDDEKIIEMRFSCERFCDCGMFIEHIGEKFLYNIWINTKGYPELDRDEVNLQNQYFYEDIYHEISKYITDHSLSYEILAIGVETVFNYCDNIYDIIKNSENVTVWAVKDNFENELENELMRKGYRKRFINNQISYVYEKRDRKNI